MNKPEECEGQRQLLSQAAWAERGVDTGGAGTGACGTQAREGRAVSHGGLGCPLPLAVKSS